MLREVFGDNGMSQSKTFLWYKRFKDGQTTMTSVLHNRQQAQHGKT
jgi:hypothetical protein